MLSLNGIIHITGEPDVGKTSFALECGVTPQELAFFDDDVKGRSTVLQLRNAGLEFGAYHDLVSIGKGLREIEFYEACMERIEAIPTGTEAVIWDTWTRFQQSLHPVVVKNPGKFRTEWAPMGTIKGAQMWQEAGRLEAQVLATLLTKVPLVIIVTHLKDWMIEGRRVPGKKVPAASGILQRISTLRLWLRRNPASPVPVALVLKRIDQKALDENGRVRTTSVLPLKLTPLENETSLWDTIARYQANPVNGRQPRPEEQPDAYEASIIDGSLTEDQRRMLELLLKTGEPELVEESFPAVSQGEIRAAVLERATLPPAQVAKEVSDLLGVSMIAPQVIAIRKG